MEQSCADQATTVHPSNEDQAQDRNGNAQLPPDVAPSGQEAPSAAVMTEMSVSRLTSAIVVRKSSEEEDNSADEDYSPESDVSTAGDDGEECDEEIPHLTQKLVLKRGRHRHAQRSGRLMNWRVLLYSNNSYSSDKFVVNQLNIYIR
ncbi:hypothetical protein JG688_00008339 [Phytophthora aleatoria]|uniref:Uncharacterized protein n=1 Tax=Phytophthora aleatoria TaxID=2496075 RepID=A0A8J5J759_9STRA|nr:hypothetical protein JG688_00008339 [Phytophthora aleatoria]